MSCSPPTLITTYKKPVLQYVPLSSSFLLATYGRFPDEAIILLQQRERESVVESLDLRLSFPSFSSYSILGFYKQ